MCLPERASSNSGSCRAFCLGAAAGALNAVTCNLLIVHLGVVWVVQVL